MKQTGRYFIALGCVLCAAILVLDGDVVAAGALSGVQLCLQTVIPSLFCFMVLTGFLINSGLYRLISLPLGPLTKGLFCLPPSMGSVVLLSLIGGYPMGAKSIAGLLEQGRLDRATAQQMLPFCCCAGPSFIITAVGSGMFGSAQAGILLYLVQLFVSILLGAVLGMREHGQQRRMLCDPLPTQRASDFMPMSQAFVLSVSQAVSALGQMCGFVILFKGVVGHSLLHPGGRRALLPAARLAGGDQRLSAGKRAAVGALPCLLLPFVWRAFRWSHRLPASCAEPACAFAPFCCCGWRTPFAQGGIVLLLLRLFPQAVGVFSSVARPGAHRKCQHPPLLTVCLVMMSALLLIQTQPLIQKGCAAFPTKRAVKKIGSPFPLGRGADFGFLFFLCHPL